MSHRTWYAYLPRQNQGTLPMFERLDFIKFKPFGNQMNQLKPDLMVCQVHKRKMKTWIFLISEKMAHFNVPL
jgi:hypothetical protein